MLPRAASVLALVLLFSCGVAGEYEDNAPVTLYANKVNFADFFFRRYGVSSRVPSLPALPG